MPQITQTGRRLKLRQLEVLIAVAQAGNMARAAGQLAITQPVISKTIADLESVVGMRLFDRNRRGVELTLYGRALFDRSVAIFNDLKTGIAELETLSDPTAGELRIGSSDAVAAGMMSDHRPPITAIPASPLRGDVRRRADRLAISRASDA